MSLCEGRVYQSMLDMVELGIRALFHETWT